MDWKKTDEQKPEPSKRQYLCYYAEYNSFDVLTYQKAREGCYWYSGESFVREEPELWCKLPEMEIYKILRKS